MKEPIAKRIPKELKCHDHVRVDDYYWMNDRENPDVIKYIEDENAYCQDRLKSTETLQEKLYDEIVGRIKQDDTSVPYSYDGDYYYTRYEKGLEYPIYCVRFGGKKNEEKVLLNVNDLGEGQSYCQVGGMALSSNKQILAYSADFVGRRIYTIYFLDLVSGQLIGDTIENTTGSITWANDNKTVFYTIKDESLRPYKIMKHQLLSKQSFDVEVYHEDDETFTVAIYKTNSKKFLMIACGSTVSTEYRYLSADAPHGDFVLIQERERDLEYDVAHFNDSFIVYTNYNAKNFCLMRCGLEKTQKENWEIIIEHREDIYLEGFELFDDFLVLQEKIEGLNNLRVINQITKDEHYIDFGEEVYTSYIGTNLESDSKVLRYGYTSLTTPTSVIDYDMESKEKTILKEQEVVGGYNKALYKSKRIWVEARDGVRVPVSVVSRKDIERSKENPLLLYAYGSYGSSTDVYFSSTRLSLLDRGFSFAIAHIRGGEELGRKWYEDGKMLNKKNTFNDFVDCGKHLVQKGYTSSEHLYAMGGSAGGLLMGVVVNDAPGLFNGVIAAVPFVDVVTTMLDTSIPLTTGEYDEWGNPNEKEYYDYMLSYSPYDQIKKQAYPNMLISSGLHDSQVQYWEPTKWIAKLRAARTDKNILILYTNMDAGHGGASGRFAAQKETAMEYAFFLMLEGLTE